MTSEIVKRIKQAHKDELKIEWKPYELYSDSSMVPDINSIYIKTAWLTVERLASENAIKIKRPSFIPFSQKALETAEFAREHGKFELCHELIYHAYFLEGKNIGKEEPLLEIIRPLNLNQNELKANWKAETYLEAIKTSIRELDIIGSTGVPTFLIGNENQRMLVGFQPQDAIEKVILKAKKNSK